MNDDQIPALLGSQGKRNSYSTDFKIKVLEYYLKNGGDAVFGLKSRTADHFNIGKKTVVRIVESKEALFKAKAIKSKKSLHSVIKAASTSKVVNVSKKIPVKVAATAKSLPATKSLSISNRVTAQPHAISVKSSTNKNVSLGAVQSVSSSASTNVSSTATSASSQATDASSKAAEFCNRTPLLMNEQEEVFDLPEDPDYSILKLPIAGGTSASGVAGPALLLSTATEEVRHALIYECEVLYECKVCRSLFRSVVNFLAHKRIFCTQNYNANKNLYPKGESSCFTPHSSSVISSDYSSGGGAKTCKEPQTSSATNTGSSAFYDRLASVEQQRAADSQDCHIELECVADGASNAVFQSVRHPGTEHSQPDLKEVREHECGVMAILGEDGRVVATVNLSDGTNMAASTTALPIKQTNMAASTTALPIKQEPQDTAQEEQSTSRLQCLDCSECFDDASCLDAHVRSSHSSADPTGFSCPICGGSFPSLWAVSKHLQTIHHKTKAQTEHLRQTIKNNSNKDKQTPSSASGPLDSGASAADALDGGVEVKTEPLDPPMLSSPQRDKEEVRASRQSSLLRCPDCSMFFVSHRSLEAHKEFYCQLDAAQPAPSRRASIEAIQERPLTRTPVSESPTKKIGIQIRKVYKTEDKELPPTFDLRSTSDNDESSSLSRINNNDGSGIKFEVGYKYPNSQGPLSDTFIMGKVMSFCSLEKFRCTLCRKNFCNGSSVRKHAAIHLRWTRFLCLLCGFRDYQECRMVKHVCEVHQVQAKETISYYTESHFINGDFRKELILPSSDLSSSENSLKRKKRAIPNFSDNEEVSPKRTCTKESQPGPPKLMHDQSTEKQFLKLKLKRVQLDVRPSEGPSPIIAGKDKSLESIIKKLGGNTDEDRDESSTPLVMSNEPGPCRKRSISPSEVQVDLCKVRTSLHIQQSGQVTTGEATKASYHIRSRRKKRPPTKLSPSPLSNKVSGKKSLRNFPSNRTSHSNKAGPKIQKGLFNKKTKTSNDTEMDQISESILMEPSESTIKISSDTRVQLNSRKKIASADNDYGAPNVVTAWISPDEEAPLSPKESGFLHKKTLTPEKSVQKPKEETLTPKQKTQTPKKEMPTPEIKTSKPENKSRSPRNHSLSPEKKTSTPRKTTLTSENRTLTLVKTALTPEKKTFTLDKMTLAPETKMFTLGKTTLVSEKKTLTPGKTTSTPVESMLSLGKKSLTLKKQVPAIAKKILPSETNAPSPESAVPKLPTKILMLKKEMQTSEKKILPKSSLIVLQRR
ncbi:uncharacterized protein LOC108680352 isoform X2 [Hyalella azteca]|uniref:Uncharacterized protein LOC108680352 isoform X2 n=1 Tax=Hyalella azteca TaxID=294128 RepID=A0A979FWH6_HYAAZ|nr:uncharacterized protein LOC108680352 isoform X2 [Hyalella azteca]